jgi:hypothetical protein
MLCFYDTLVSSQAFSDQSSAITRKTHSTVHETNKSSKNMKQSPDIRHGVENDPRGSSVAEYAISRSRVHSYAIFSLALEKNF